MFKNRQSDPQTTQTSNGNKDKIAEYAKLLMPECVNHTGSSELQRRQSSTQWLEVRQRRTTEGGWGRTG